MLFALWKGGWRERALAGVHQANSMIAYWCLATHCPLNGYWGPLGWRMAWDLTSDSAILVTCLIGAWRSDRWWVMWASAFALARVVTDLFSLHPDVTYWAAASANIMWEHLINACLVWGVIDYRRQLAAQKR